MLQLDVDCGAKVEEENLRNSRMGVFLKQNKLGC